MKNLKILGLAAAAAMAVTAFWGVGTASATELYKFTTPSANDTLGQESSIKASLKSETSAAVKPTSQEFNINTCTQWDMEGEITTPGGASSHPVITLTSWSIAGCTDTMHVLAPGKLEVQHEAGTTTEQ